MTLHFAYGSNMSRRDMALRCPGAAALGIAALDGWRFVITRDGYASIVRHRGGVVHGALWRLQPRDVAALDAYEDIASSLYRRSSLTVRRNAQSQRAMVYVGRDRPQGQPKPGYMDGVLDAARDWDLPPDYVRSLEQFALPQRHDMNTEARA